MHDSTVDQGSGLNGSMHTVGLHLTGRRKGLEGWLVTSPDFKCESSPKGLKLDNNPIHSFCLKMFMVFPEDRQFFQKEGYSREATHGIK